MNRADEVKGAILASLGSALQAHGFTPEAVPDDFDLRGAGLVDSLGFLRLLVDLEQRLAVPIDLSALDPERLTHLGALSRHIAGGNAG
jgi:acyl carrier protein